MNNEHLTALLNLKKQYQGELQQLRSSRSTDPFLTQDGKDAQARQDADRLKAKYAAELDTLTARMSRDTSLATTTALKVAGTVPALAPAESRAEWERVTMLLDAGAGINTVVRNADVARLQAIQQWGPTYLEAQALKDGPGGLAGVGQEVDLLTFQSQVRDRLAEVLPNGQHIKAGAESAGVAAQFTRQAQTFSERLNGQHNIYDAVGEAIDAEVVGRIAAANFNPLEAG